MGLRSRIVMLAAVLAAALGPSLAAPDAQPSAAARAALRHYLRVDCEVGEEGAARQNLLRHAESLRPELARLLLDGPGAAMRDELAVDLDAAWERRSAFLASNPRLGLDPEMLLTVTTLSRSDFLARETRRFDLACREKAVAALAAIGSPAARRSLRDARYQVDDEVRAWIEAALKRLRPAARNLRRPDRPRAESPGNQPRTGR